MVKGSENPFPYITLVDTADPATPPAGQKYLWVDTDDALKIIDEAAVVTAVGGDVSAHTADTTDAHDASAVSFTPAGTIAATDVQAAIEEVAAEATGTADTVRNQVGNGAIIIPSLAAHPDINVGGGSDDEFDTTDTSDPMTGWTTLGTPTSHNINSTVKSHYYVDKAAAAGSGLTGIYKAWTPTNGDIWTCKLGGFSGRLAENLAGLAIFDGPSGVAHVGGNKYTGTVVSTIGAYSFTTPTGTQATLLGAGSSAPISVTPLYIRLTYVSSTSVTWSFSLDGILYTIFHNYNPGFTPDSIALVVQSGSASAGATAAFDWIRKT